MKFNIGKMIILGILSLLCMATPAQSRTWQVEKDGSGDFTVIQDAVDAAEEGDVIEIGPGRFDDTISYGGYWTVFILVEGKSLTFRGSGIGVTIIGPPELMEHDSIEGFAVLDHAAFCRIENLTIENINGLCIGMSSNHFEMENVHFANGYMGYQGMSVQGGLIRNCSFNNFSSTAVTIESPSVGMVVEDCQMDDVRYGVIFNQSGVQNGIARNCNIFIGEDRWLGHGVSVKTGASAEVYNCHIEGAADGTGISVFSTGSKATIHDCTVIMPYGVGIHLSDYQVLMSNCTIMAGTDCFVISGPQRELTPDRLSHFNNNQFIRLGDAMYVSLFLSNWPLPLEHIDMTNNDWGTQDLDEIAEYIHDMNDFPEYLIVVDYEPISGGTVATESVSWDQVKALYRDATR